MDTILNLLHGKLNGRSSEEIRVSLLQNEARNELSQLVLQRAADKLAVARKQYFLKPVITLPFFVSDTTVKLALIDNDNLREVTCRAATSVPDETFQLRKFLTVHWILRKIISESAELTPERCNDASMQLVTDGINNYNYAITHRTTLPIHTIFSSDADPYMPTVTVVNLYDATRTVSQIINDLAARERSCGSYLVTPYTRDMWHFMFGINIEGGYTFRWMSSKSVSTEVNSPQLLNDSFFKSKVFSNYELRIRPIGSSKVFILSRYQFLQLFSNTYNEDYDQVMVRSVAGFAVLDFTIFPYAIRNDIILNFADPLILNKGYTHLMPLLLSNYMLSRYTTVTNTCNTAGYYVSAALLNSFKRIAFTLSINHNYISTLITHIITFSKLSYFSRKAIRFRENMSPELLCHILEYILPSIFTLRLTLLHTKLTHIFNTVEDIGLRLSKYAALRVFSFSEDKLVDKLLSNQLLDELENSARRYMLSPQSITVSTKSTTSEPTANRLLYMNTVLDSIEALFPTSPEYSLKLTRDIITPESYNSFLTTLKDSFIYNKDFDVNIATIQAVYDDLFPGNSTIDYTAVHTQSELGNKSIIIAVPYFKVSYSDMYSSVHERLLIPSKLRTSTAADLPGSFLDMMGALMKRNFNRQAAEVPGDRLKHVQLSIQKVLHNYGVCSWRELVGFFSANPIVPGMETLSLWADKHTESDVKAAAAILTNKLTDPSCYNAMPKAQTKPILDLTAQGSIAVGQTVVFHSKDVIAISVGIFTLVLERLLLLFPSSIRFAFGADEHTVGEWADKYLDLHETYVYEFDVPKFDKSQDKMCFTLILEVLRLVGVSDDFINYWERASHSATVFNAQFSMVFTLFYGNRSGSGGTLAVNCICLLFAFYTEFSNLSIVASLIKGDDSVLVTRSEITNGHILRLLDRWGFTLKRREVRQYVSFCSGIFVKTSTDNYQLLRDPVRLLTKLGRSLSPERESSYFIDYYVSFVDATRQYRDDVAIANLKLAVYSLYNINVDVDTIIQFLRKIVVSYKVFLKELYGLSDFALSKVAKLDNIQEIMNYAKQQGFIKSKMLKDVCPTLKIPLVEKIRSYTNEIYFDSNIQVPKQDKLDMVDSMGWIHSL